MINYDLTLVIIRQEAVRRVGHQIKVKLTQDQALRLSRLAGSVGASITEFIRAQYEALDKETCLRIFKIPYIPVPVLMSDRAITRYKSCKEGIRVGQLKEKEAWQKMKERNPDAYELWEARNRSAKSSHNSSALKDRSS